MYVSRWAVCALRRSVLPRDMSGSSHGAGRSCDADSERVKELSMVRSLPEDPLIRSLVLTARRAQVTRRGVLAGATAGAATLALAACAPTGGNKPTPAPDIAARDKKAIWANWPLYLDPDEDTNAHPTLD